MPTDAPAPEAPTPPPAAPAPPQPSKTAVDTDGVLKDHGLRLAKLEAERGEKPAAPPPAPASTDKPKRWRPIIGRSNG